MGASRKECFSLFHPTLLEGGRARGVVVIHSALSCAKFVIHSALSFRTGSEFIVKFLIPLPRGANGLSRCRSAVAPRRSSTSMYKNVHARPFALCMLPVCTHFPIFFFSRAGYRRYQSSACQNLVRSHSSFLL